MKGSGFIFLMEKEVLCVKREQRGREEKCNRVQRGEAGGREGWRGSAGKDAWSLHK